MAIKIIQEKNSPLKKKKTTKKKATKKRVSTKTKKVEFDKNGGLIHLGDENKKIIENIKNGFNLAGRFIFVCAIVLAIIIGFNYSKNYLYANEKFFINNIEINGCKNVTELEIRGLLPFQVGASLFEIRLGKAEQELSNYKTELKNISMHREWLDNKVIVSLNERVPEVFINMNDKKLGLDFDNKPFKLRGNMANMKIPMMLFSNDEQRQCLLLFFQKMKSNISYLVSQITEIKYGEVDDIILTLDNKINVYWGLPIENKIEEKSYKLKKILKDLTKKKIDTESIDLSFLDKNKDMIVVKKFCIKDNDTKNI